MANLDSDQLKDQVEQVENTSEILNDVKPKAENEFTNSWKLILAGVILLIPIMYVVFTQLNPSEKDMGANAGPVQSQNGPAVALNNQALAAFQQEDFAKCIELSQEAIAMDPNSAVAYNNMGAAYNSLKEYDRAIVALSRALEINPNFQLAKNNLRWAIDEKEKLLTSPETN